jgi:sideroflexin-1/3
MATPGMVMVPIAMNAAEKKWPKVRGNMVATLAIQLGLLAVCLTFSTPLCCALFPQISSVKISDLEDDVKEKCLKKGFKETDQLYYNKGL